MKSLRAWDDVAQKMLYAKPEQFDDMLGYRFDAHFETDKPVYMWGTGLKDRNGKEIYDMDICEGEHAVYLISWNDEKAQYQAKVIKTRSVLSKHCSFPFWQYVEDDGKCRFEVIGNRWDNPNLLEG